MDKDKFLQELADSFGCSIAEARRFYQVFVDSCARALTRGELVLPELGRFVPKLRDNVGRQENSPRREKKPHYQIQFKPSKAFEKKLFEHTEQQGG